MKLWELAYTLTDYIEEGYEDAEVFVRIDQQGLCKIVDMDISTEGVVLYPEENYEETHIHT